jgi:hypothetical protein
MLGVDCHLLRMRIRLVILSKSFVFFQHERGTHRNRGIHMGDQRRTSRSTGNEGALR